MSDTATLPTPTKKPPRQIREFRLMYRPTSTTAGAEKTPKTKEPKTRKVALSNPARYLSADLAGGRNGP